MVRYQPFYYKLAIHKIKNHKQGLREGGSGGTSYPGLGGPGLRGPGRVQVPALSCWKALFHRKFLSSFLLILTQI